MTKLFCDCGNEAWRDSGRCEMCEREHANRLGDWKNPVFDGPRKENKPLANINAENAGE